MKPNELDALIEDCLEGRLNETDAVRLNAELQTSAQARNRYWESASIHALLEPAMQQASLRAVTGQAAPSFARAIAWHPVAVAAVGILFGMVCTSLVMAYITPSAAKTITLLSDGFEDGSQPWTAGFPSQASVWGGDRGQVVAGENRIQPLDGRQMARLDPSLTTTLSYLERILDLRSLPVAGTGEVRQVAVTASFHAAERGLRDRYTLRVAAFADDPENVRKQWVGREWREMEDALAASKRAISTRPDAEGWQTLTAIVEIPRDAQSVVISLGSGLFEDPDRKTAHYVDGVQATLSIGPRSPHTKNKRNNSFAP